MEELYHDFILLQNEVRKQQKEIQELERKLKLLSNLSYKQNLADSWAEEWERFK